MWLNKDGYLLDLEEVYRIRRIKETESEHDPWGIIFEFINPSRESWSKFYFSTEEERDYYFSQISDLLKATEIEDDILGKLK